MTEQNTDPGQEPEVTPAPEGEPQEPEAKAGEGGNDQVAQLRKEAASYRRKLRAAEVQVEQLDSRLADYDRAEVERQVTGDGGLQSAADFWLAVQLDDLRDEQRALDPAKIKAARERVLKEHPHWREPAPDFSGGARQSEPPSRPSFGDAVKQAGSS